MKNKVLNLLWKKFIYNGHLLSLGTVAIAISVLALMKIDFSLLFLILMYSITFIVYSFDRNFDIEKDDSKVRSELSATNKREIIIASILLAITLGITSLSKNFLVFGLFLFLSVFGLLYTIFFKKLTRFVLGFKSYYVALLYSMVIIFIPPFYNLSYSPEIFLLFIFFTLRWFINTSFCDIKDIDSDRKDGYKTFACRFNQGSFIRFLSIFNIFSALPLIIGVLFYSLPFWSLLYLLTIPYAFYFFSLPQKKADLQIVTNEWADGEILLWLLLSIIIKIWNI